MKKAIVVLPGDGIGPEVSREAVKIVTSVGRAAGMSFRIRERNIGGAALDREGQPVSDETVQMCRDADAVFLGAVGGPEWDDLPKDQKPETGLLRLRKELGLYTNLRPVVVFPSLAEASTLRREIIEDIDILVVRELTGGIYFGTPRFIRPSEGGEYAVDTMAYETQEIERIARSAFEAARKRKKKVVSVDKANVLMSSALWRRTVTRIAESYPDVLLEHMLVDNCAMQLIRNPRQFDVILTCNLFGDILSDEASMLTGSLGMLPSASLGDGPGMYEPVHGSAPDIAGRDLANPLAAIGSAALMFRYSLGSEEAAGRIERAVRDVLDGGCRTPDIDHGGTGRVGTREMGDRVLERALR